MSCTYVVTSLANFAARSIVSHLRSVDIQDMSDVRDICDHFSPVSIQLADNLKLHFADHPIRSRNKNVKLYSDFMKEVLELKLVVNSYVYSDQTFLLDNDSFAAIICLVVVLPDGKDLLLGIKTVEL